MPWVSYTASESVMALHIAGISYTFNFRVQRADQAVEILKREQRAMAGKKETLYFGRLSTWEITLEPIPASETALVLEFLDSTADGQMFTFDPYGSNESPGRPMQVDRDDTGYTVVRKTSTGDAQFSDLLEYSFKLSEIA